MEKTPIHLPCAQAKTLADALLYFEDIYEPPVPIHELLEEFAEVYPCLERTDQSYFFEYHDVWQVCTRELTAKSYPGYSEALLLGHFLLQHLEYDWKTLTPAQLAAFNLGVYCFADNVTMPDAWLHYYCHNKLFNQTTLDYLSTMFKVNPDQILQRLHNLGLYSTEDLQNWRQPIRKSPLKENESFSTFCQHLRENSSDDATHH